MDLGKLKQFGKLQDEVYELTKGEIPLITFYDDTQGVNIHNPMLDATGRFSVNPVLEYGKDALLSMEEKLEKMESDMGVSVYEMTSETLRRYLGGQFFKGREAKEDDILNIPLSLHSFHKTQGELPIHDALRFEIPVFDGMERLFPEATLKSVMPLDQNVSLHMYAQYDIENDKIFLCASCQDIVCIVNPSERASDILKEKMNVCLDREGKAILSEYVAAYIDEEIASCLRGATKDTWYVEADENGCCEIEIAADYRENNKFLLQTLYDHRNEAALKSHILEEIHNSYEETIWAYEKELIEKAGFIEGTEFYDRAREILPDIITFHPDYEHFTKEEVRLNVLLGTENEQNSDFSSIHDDLGIHSDEDQINEKHPDMDVFHNALTWLIYQQGYSLSDFYKVKEAYDASFGVETYETIGSYNERYEAFAKEHSPFLSSLCQELDNQFYSMGALTILVKSSIDEYAQMFERLIDEDGLIKKELVFDKNVTLGIFNPWHGASSCLDITLEKNLVLPNDLVFDVQVEGATLDNGYSLNHVCDLIGSCWKECKEIRLMGDNLMKDSLDAQILDAAKEVRQDSKKGIEKNDYER